MIEFGHTPKPQEPHPLGGEWWQYEFPNGFGASVIRNDMSYGGPQGLYELAVTHQASLCYATPLTSDVMSYLEATEVEQALDAIEKLDANPSCKHR